jgi:gluconate 5-dehydrogenase
MPQEDFPRVAGSGTTAQGRDLGLAPQVNSPFNIAGRAFVVTGGAGHLGSRICVALANARASVLCLSSRPGKFEGLVPSGAGIESVSCELSDEGVVENAIFKFSEKHGRLDGLVNAAVRAPRGINLDMPAKQFETALSGILTHYFTTARIVTHYMNAGGSIVNLASMWGLVGPDERIYLDLKNEPSAAMAAGAGGILGLTRFLASVMAKDNVRVNALVPGWFPKKRGPERPDYMKEITTRVPMGRIGQPDELVGAVLFLLSSASSYMTGQQLVIDGGYTIR